MDLPYVDVRSTIGYHSNILSFLLTLGLPTCTQSLGLPRLGWHSA